MVNLINNKKKKEHLWAKVRAVICQDSRIQETVQMTRGEQTDVWEWIGPVV